MKKEMFNQRVKPLLTFSPGIFFKQLSKYFTYLVLAKDIFLIFPPDYFQVNLLKVKITVYLHFATRNSLSFSPSLKKLLQR